ncbi:two-component system response regulator [Desulfobacteraceae bacterium SEEP-SAG10]|nr:two-component system response regulator [Desulfobacteraceae bacterium SEEP-SAG10]
MAATLKRPAIILLAEDDLGDQELTKRALKEGKIENELYVVKDGEEALDYLFRRGRYTDPETSPRPDLFLLDLNMPKLDGRQVLEQICSIHELRNIRVVVLTTSHQEEDITRSYDLGVHSYITKPVDLDQFFNVIRTLEEYWLQIVVLPKKDDK